MTATVAMQSARGMLFLVVDFSSGKSCLFVDFVHHDGPCQIFPRPSHRVVSGSPRPDSVDFCEVAGQQEVVLFASESRFVFMTD